jgi:hypothetical protein
MKNTPGAERYDLWDMVDWFGEKDTNINENKKKHEESYVWRKATTIHGVEVGHWFVPPHSYDRLILFMEGCVRNGYCSLRFQNVSTASGWTLSESTGREWKVRESLYCYVSSRNSMIPAVSRLLFTNFIPFLQWRKCCFIASWHPRTQLVAPWGARFMSKGSPCNCTTTSPLSCGFLELTAWNVGIYRSKLDYHRCQLGGP